MYTHQHPCFETGFPRPILPKNPLKSLHPSTSQLRTSTTSRNNRNTPGLPDLRKSLSQTLTGWPLASLPTNCCDPRRNVLVEYELCVGGKACGAARPMASVGVQVQCLGREEWNTEDAMWWAREGRARRNRNRAKS